MLLILLKKRCPDVSKIKDLKNSADINWNDLENQDRVIDVKNLIKEMGRT